MANVNFYRDTKANIDNVAYTDGQMYFPTDQNKIYLDTGNQRKQYGGDTEVDSALSTISTNPVQNNTVTYFLNQKVAKTDVVNDLDSAVAVTATNVPVGCGAIKELNTSLTEHTTFPSEQGAFYPDYQDGKYGFNTDALRGADTFVPFKTKPDRLTILDANITTTNSNLFYDTLGYTKMDITANINLSVTVRGRGTYTQNTLNMDISNLTRVVIDNPRGAGVLIVLHD